jgi:hypothetical protein
LYSNPTGLFLAGVAGGGPPKRILGQFTPGAVLSPDETWVLYRSPSDSGLYAQPVSGAVLPKQIASTGSYAIWRSDGKEILFLANAGVSSIRVEGSGDALRFATAERLFSADVPVGTNASSHPLAVNRDGSRIYLSQSAQSPGSGAILVRTGAIR